jgi:unsaturated rhamnogalacturonyl hydrolase
VLGRLDDLQPGVRVLQDESGLFWHFWLERTQARYGFAWSRGQGWALLGLLDLHDGARARRGWRLPRALTIVTR